jgi:hypothetical protein
MGSILLSEVVGTSMLKEGLSTPLPQFVRLVTALAD